MSQYIYYCLQISFYISILLIFNSSYPPFYQNYPISDAIQKSDSWTSVSHFNATSARQHAIAFSIDNKGYVGLGKSANGPDAILYNDLWEYDPTDNSWTQKSNFPGKARYDSVAFVIENKAYVGTGQGKSGYLHDFWEYNPATDEWRQISSLANFGRDRAVAFSLHKKGYVGLGSKGTGQKNLLKDFWKYDPKKDRWIKLNDFGGSARHSSNAFLIENKIVASNTFKETSGVAYVVAGHDGYFDGELWKYDSKEDTWEEMSSLPMNRFSSVAFGIGTKGYVCTGGNPSSIADFWMYDSTQGTWEALDIPPFYPRQSAVSFKIDKFIYLGAGSDHSGLEVYPDFWRYKSL